MAYRIKSRNRYYAEVPYKGTWRQLALRTNDRRIALKIETMWQVLAEKHRAWDILDRVIIEKTLRVDALYDLWLAHGEDVHAVRAKIEDVNLADYVEAYLKHYSKGDRAADTKAKVAYYLAALCSESKPLLRSNATTDALTTALYSYDASASTIRKVHSAWSGFFDYVKSVKRVMSVNPMLSVERPVQRKPPVEFYEMETVELIVQGQPTVTRRALYALIYGTGMDVTPAVEVRRVDINPDTREVRCKGTKANTRDRVARVADWAWEIFWPVARLAVGTGRVFPQVSRWTVSDWHRETVVALEIKPELPARMARHHWAVRALRSGTPTQLVAEQLGHATPDMTLRIYGRFLTDAKQRAYWEEKATEYETRRRQAGER